MNTVTLMLNGEKRAFRVPDVSKESVFTYIKKIKADDGGILGYRVLKDIGYYSERYKKWVVCEAGDRSDGATFAEDIDSFGWLFHDELCNDGSFEDGTKCNNLQASAVCSDLLALSGHWFRRNTWFVATWLFGGGKARKNGMI